MFRPQWKRRKNWFWHVHHYPWPGLCSWSHYWLCVVISYHQWWHTHTHTHVLYWNTVHNERQFFVCVWKYEYLPFLCELSPWQKPPWTSEGHTLFLCEQTPQQIILVPASHTPAVITCSEGMKAGSVRGWELVTDCDNCVCVSLKYMEYPATGEHTKLMLLST